MSLCRSQRFKRRQIPGNPQESGGTESRRHGTLPVSLRSRRTGIYIVHQGSVLRHDLWTSPCIYRLQRNTVPSYSRIFAATHCSTSDSPGSSLPIGNSKYIHMISIPPHTMFSEMDFQKNAATPQYSRPQGYPPPVHRENPAAQTGTESFHNPEMFCRGLFWRCPLPCVYIRQRLDTGTLPPFAA